MSRSDWSILAALAGLAALFVAFGIGSYVTALHYPEEQRYQPYRYAAEQPKQIESTAAAQSNAQPLQHRTPCSQPEGQGESDLCAQWKAANAARDSAFWTKWGVWIGIIGSSLLLWQIMLTRKAVEDTSEATNAMREANEIARQSVRPWLKLEIESEFSFEPGEAGAHLIKIFADAKNFGNAPAVNVTAHVSLLAGRSFNIVTELERLTGRGNQLGIYGTAIHPTDAQRLEPGMNYGVNEFEMPDPHEGGHPFISRCYYIGIAAFYRSPNIPLTFYTAAFYRLHGTKLPTIAMTLYGEPVGGELHGALPCKA